MRWLILNTDYGEFLRWLYGKHPGLDRRRYADQLQAMNDSLWGIADFWSSNLSKLGHEAFDVHANCPGLQQAWAREHPVDRTFVRKMKNLVRRPQLDWDILASQILHYRPDVLYCQAMDQIPCAFLSGVKAKSILIGQHAATPLPESDWVVYDLVVSSFPPTVEALARRGVRATLHRLCFEPAVLSRIGEEPRTVPVSFVGSFFSVHRSRTKLLEHLARQVDLKVWGPSIGENSPLRQIYQGQAWGTDMYRILRQSKIVVNHHGDVPPYANNMRLFEATGMGALLITDWKENLRELFEPEVEVVPFRTDEECANRVRYYLEHDGEREAIAAAGQRRTLRDHTYLRRAEELVELVKKVKS